MMWVRHQREEFNISLNGKEMKQWDVLLYFGGMVTEDGHSEVEVRRRAWRKAKEVMLGACVTPACLYGLETVALTEQQQQKLQVCENNWDRLMT